ncbi:MAG: hypothetical protein ACRENJ_10005 [Candidatus Eiseniibacteriota bacterium]
MKTRPYVAAAVLFALAALVAASGCSRQTATAPELRNVFPPEAPAPVPNDSVPSDSVPIPPPPPPPPPAPAPILPIAFAGGDTAIAGTTTHLHWAVGNASEAPFRVDYRLECALPWPGFPLTGSITIAARTVVPLSTPATIPSDAASGTVGFTMTVTRPGGIPPTSAQGALNVVSNEPPPPPPPPPIQPVVYVGADSVWAGGAVTQTWEVTNESPQPFTMQWTLASRHPWPGYPVSGMVSLAGGGSATVTTTGAVPDTAGPGPRWSSLTVSRPSGLPPASADGGFHVFR